MTDEQQVKMRYPDAAPIRQISYVETSRCVGALRVHTELREVRKYRILAGKWALSDWEYSSDDAWKVAAARSLEARDDAALR
jgi:hypothetical protein